MRKSKIAVMITVFSMLMMTFSGCGKTEKEKVSMTVWTSEDSHEVMQEIVDEFIEKYKDEADFDIKVGNEEENCLWKNIKDYPEKAVDVFCMVDDQLDDLVNADLLLPITENIDEIIEKNGGEDSIAVQCAMRNGTMYAYPMTTGNGYFLYYNSEYLTEEDVQSMDRILEVAEQNGKSFAMDWTSGWYLYSFFKGAGFSLEVCEDRVGNECNWNQSVNGISGAEVAEAMIKIASSPAFLNAPDEMLKKGFEDGSIIAGVNGLWNSEYLKQCMGENFAATKLPCYTVSGKQIQMGSFEGCKLVGVNSKTKEQEWSLKLADWITSGENQMLRYEAIGEIPSDINAASEKDLADSPTVKAILEQSKFSSVQRIGSNYWTPATAFGTVLASGNKENTDLQKLLDKLVKDIDSNE